MQYQKPVMVQEQKLKMNPQLFQSIQLMTLPIQELKFRIQEEIEKNPALEVVEDRAEESFDAAESRQNEEEDYFENSSDPGYSQAAGEEARDQKHRFLEGALSRPESLQDHLIWQLRLQPIPEKWFEIGTLLIRNLDEQGFHREDPLSLVPEEDKTILNSVMLLIQRFDPVGTCVSSFKESLLVQTAANPDAPERTTEMILEHFELLERGKLHEIGKLMKLSQREIEEIVDFIRTLNPFPGRTYSTENPRYVIPDLLLKQKEGEFLLVLNDEEIPVLGINPFFAEIAKSGAEKTKNREVRQFANRSIKDARWFIRSVNQRNETLIKVAKAIVEFQRDFFTKGPKFLVPLTLKDIAQEVSVHETTVSRISSGKYIQTEWGIFELKYFFSNSISGPGSAGSRFSKEGVKQILKEIIEENREEKSLSDQKLADLLSKRGISLARRTVAKYRKELDILSSYER